MIKKWGRYIVCITILVLVFVLYIFRLGQWQLIDGASYAAEAEVSSSFIKLTGARGEILDSEGETLAGNRTVYNVVYSRITWDADSRNETLLAAARLLESVGETWVDRLPIAVSGSRYVFAQDKTSEIGYLTGESMLDLGANASAADCMAALVERYGLEDFGNMQDARDVASMRYNMERGGFSRTSPYTVARDVPIETVEVVSERMEAMPGIEIEVGQARDYGSGTTAPHVIGTLGLISEAQYAAAQEAGNTYSSANVSGYSYTDTVGQSGIEQVYEEVLRGKNGKETIETDATGAVLGTSVTEPPEAGDTVWLTVDADLQRAAAEALDTYISSGLTEDCVAGAVVALDVNSGAVLACVSYPTFDLGLYSTDDAYLTALYEDETQPLFNRGLNGIFTPGSIFKPIVAVAALEENIIQESDTPVSCDGAYHYYAPDYEPACLGEHGELNVTHALSRSCNVFFYDVGRQLTINRLTAYAQRFALGEATGSELPESTGILATPAEYEERHAGETWYDGMTIQAAIGQNDNMFTPIELAVYCSMIANGGVRYRTHFLEKVTDYDRTKTVSEYTPEILDTVEISDETFRTVREGMRLVCTEGTASSTFADFGVAVAGKTGTAENAGHSDNLTFIGYAPYDKPEIAVAVVVEYGGGGDAAREIAKSVLEAYFFGDTDDADAEPATDGAVNAAE